MKSTVSEVMHIPETLTNTCHFFLPANTQFPWDHLYERFSFFQCTYLLLPGDQLILFSPARFSAAVPKHSGESDFNAEVYLCSQFGAQPTMAGNSRQQGLEAVSHSCNCNQKEESN